MSNSHNSKPNGKISSLQEALAQRNAREAKRAAQEPAVSQFAQEGEAPSRMPYPGETVLFHWQDPNLVGALSLTLGFLVSQANAKSADGRCNGWVVMDPTMSMPGPGGQPMQAPALIPVVNSAYSSTPKAMTWRFREDAAAPAVENAPDAAQAQALLDGGDHVDG